MVACSSSESGGLILATMILHAFFALHCIAPQLETRRRTMCWMRKWRMKNLRKEEEKEEKYEEKDEGLKGEWGGRWIMKQQLLIAEAAGRAWCLRVALPCSYYTQHDEDGDEGEYNYHCFTSSQLFAWTLHDYFPFLPFIDDGSTWQKDRHR